MVAPMVASEADLIARLDALGIAYKTYRHPAVFTVEEANALRRELPGGHCKSLFLKDRRANLPLPGLRAAATAGTSKPIPTPRPPRSFFSAAPTHSDTP